MRRQSTSSLSNLAIGRNSSTLRQINDSVYISARCKPILCFTDWQINILFHQCTLWLFHHVSFSPHQATLHNKRPCTNICLSTSTRTATRIYTTTRKPLCRPMCIQSSRPTAVRYVDTY